MPRNQDAGGHGGTTLRARLGRLVLKPPAPAQSPKVAPRRSVEELEAVHRYADDKERLVGLLAAPLAALIAILVVRSDVAHLKAGSSTAVYEELLVVLVVLAVVMVVTAWLRKRLFLGCALALYGLAVFNLHYWGFGVPFLLFGAWLLVRARRAQRDLREATNGGRGASGRGAGRPAQSRRYTPPSGGSRRAPARGAKGIKGAGEQKAG